MPNLVVDLIVDRVDLVDEGANSAAFIKLFKRRENEPSMDFEQILAELKPEHAEVVRDAVAKAKAEVPKETAEELEAVKAKYDSAFDELENVKKSKNKTEEPDFEEVLKSADPAVQAVFKTMKMQKEAAEQAARLVVEKAAHDEAVAKARTFAALPVEEDELVEVLKSADEKVLSILEAANNALNESANFVEVGKSTKAGAAEVKVGANKGWDIIEKAAKALQDTDPSLSYEQAVAKAMKNDKNLYREYLKGVNE